MWQRRLKAMAPFGQHKHGSMFQEKRMARKKNTGIYIAALLLFLGGVGYNHCDPHSRGSTPMDPATFRP